MSEAIFVDKSNEKKISFIIRLIVFLSLSLIIFLQAVFSFVALVAILTASPEEIQLYPFGTEHGYAYSSQETYLAVQLFYSFICSQALFISAYFYKMNQKNAAIIVLSLPLALWACFRILALN